MDFTERLKQGIVHFVYAKTSGEEREAFGTLREDLIPANKEQLIKFRQGLEDTKNSVGRVVEIMAGGSLPVSEYRGALEQTIEGIDDLFHTPKKTERKMSEDLQMYYDFEAQGFRSFKKSNLLRIITI